jgi:hypothetical protein
VPADKDENGEETFQLFCGIAETEWIYENEKGIPRYRNGNDFF